MSRTWRAQAAAAAATAVLALSACGGGGGADAPPDVAEQEDEQTRQLEAQVGETDDDTAGLGEDLESGMSVEALEGHLGEQVSFDGEVTSVFGPNALTIGGSEVGEDAILVVGEDLPDGVAAGDFARVEGEVTTFVLPDVETLLGVDLPEDDIGEFDGGPAVVAESVVVE